MVDGSQGKIPSRNWTIWGYTYGNPQFRTPLSDFTSPDFPRLPDSFSMSAVAASVWGTWPGRYLTRPAGAARVWWEDLGFSSQQHLVTLPPHQKNMSMWNLKKQSEFQIDVSPFFGQKHSIFFPGASWVAPREWSSPDPGAVSKANPK